MRWEGRRYRDTERCRLFFSKKNKVGEGAILAFGEREEGDILNLFTFLLLIFYHRNINTDYTHNPLSTKIIIFHFWAGGCFFCSSKSQLQGKSNLFSPILGILLFLFLFGIYYISWL